MQKAKIIDNSLPNGDFQDSSSQAALDGTVLRSIFQNDNFNNLFEFVTGAGYELIDDDVSQITKASRGLYNPAFTYNTSNIATQSVNDIVRGSDGKYYEAQADTINGDDPVGSVTGDWTPTRLDKAGLTQAQVDYVIFNRNRTLQDVTSSRFSGVTETNNESGDIELMIYLSGPSATLEIEGSNISGFDLAAGKEFLLSGTVASGETYELTGTGIIKWTERR